MTPIEKDHARGLNGALAAEIRAELGVQKMSGRKLAEAAEIDRLTLQRYLNGQRGLSTAYVEAIAGVLGVSAGDLMLRAVARRDANPALYGPGSVSAPSGTPDAHDDDSGAAAEAAMDDERAAGDPEDPDGN